ncbi:MAG: PAS domain S-box protein [Cyclobacteriaceae bacterium]|nr:PAS domain S-box protein [Cyclobacteriaceae bacterium]
MPRLNLSTHSFTSGLKPNTLGILTFILLLFLTSYFSVKQYNITTDRESFEAYALVNEAKNRMQEVFSYSISATELLAFLVQEYDDEAINDFDSIAAKILQAQKFIDAIELLPGGTICCVYPLKGNEPVIGYNILEDPTRNREAFEAIERRQLFFAGPFALKQGGTAVVGRLPIFKGEKFWGFSAVLIKLSTLLEAANIDTLAHNGFQFQLSKINPNTGKEEFFLKENEKGKKTYTSQMTIPSGEFKLSVTRLDKSSAVKETIPIFVFGLLLSFTAAGFIRAMSKAPVFLGQKLDQSEKNYRKVFENTSEGIFRSTMEGKLLLANPSLARLFGYDSPDEMINLVENIGDQLYYSPQERERFLGDLLLKGAVTKMEFQSLTRDKKKIWISISAHLSYEKDNTISYIEGTITDITVRKNDRDKLNEQFEVLMKYAFINSHEVRAHVATLLGLVNLFNEGHITDKEKDDVIKLIAAETAALDKVIRGLSTLINEVEEY